MRGQGKLRDVLHKLDDRSLSELVRNRQSAAGEKQHWIARRQG
jgi:hypothetical protein